MSPRFLEKVAVGSPLGRPGGGHTHIGQHIGPHIQGTDTPSRPGPPPGPASGHSVSAVCPHSQFRFLGRPPLRVAGAATAGRAHTSDGVSAYGRDAGRILRAHRPDRAQAPQHAGESGWTGGGTGGWMGGRGRCMLPGCGYGRGGGGRRGRGGGAAHRPRLASTPLNHQHPNRKPSTDGFKPVT